MASKFAIAICLGAPLANAQDQMNCLAPNADSNGRWDKAPNSQGQYAVNTVLHLQCNAGYAPFPADAFGVAKMTCGNGGGMYPLWVFDGDDFPYCKSSGTGPDVPATS